MDAAVETILAGAEPETLDTSWRSRPRSSRSPPTSSRAASGATACPSRASGSKRRQRKRAAGLGPIAERWRFPANNLDEDAEALAAAVHQLLADDTVRVRDVVTQQVRRAEPRDVAILCRYRAGSARVAAALQSIGIRSVVPSAGLLATAEGQSLLAGLRLWADPGDSLAAAALARLTELPGEGDDWLSRALTDGRSFVTLPRARRVLAAREALRSAGPLQAFDAIVEALGLAALCADWGETRARLANLDALRGHAAVFGDLAAAEGAGATPAGLVAHLEELAQEDLDSQATLTTEDAVTISTWHAAKGLEWPIVVLYQIDKDQEPTVFGVAVERESEPFDARRPLAGRWLRIWPEIFTQRRSTTTLHERLGRHTVALEKRRRRDQEELRLLYVGWTRARDRVILAARGGVDPTRPSGLLDGILRHLSDENGLLLDDPKSGQATWAGQAGRSRPTHRHAARAPRRAKRSRGRSTPPRAHASTHRRGSSPRRSSPQARSRRSKSSAAALKPVAPGRKAASATPSIASSPRMILRSTLPSASRWPPESSSAGALPRTSRPPSSSNPHTACARGPSGASRERAGERSGRSRIGIRREPCCAARRTWCSKRTKRLVVIDHKTFQSTRDQALELARGFAGQVGSYAAALAEATGKSVLGCFIHLPVVGVIAEVRP